MRLTRMRRIERIFQKRMRLQKSHASIPTQYRIGRRVSRELLRFVESLERVLDRRERVVTFVAQQIWLFA